MDLYTFTADLVVCEKIHKQFLIEWLKTYKSYLKLFGYNYRVINVDDKLITLFSVCAILCSQHPNKEQRNTLHKLINTNIEAHLDKYISQFNITIYNIT